MLCVKYEVCSTVGLFTGTFKKLRFIMAIDENIVCFVFKSVVFILKYIFIYESGIL